MKPPIKIVAGELVRDPAWTDGEYDEHLRRHRADQRLGAAHLLSLAAAHVVRTICALPDHIEADVGHLQHTIGIADSVERMAERDGYWTTDAAQALMDLKSARLRASELIRDAQRDDLRTQYQQAILVDFYGPAERLQRLAGLGVSGVVERVRDLELDPGIAEMLRPAHRRARALVQLAEEKHGDAPADEALAAAIAAVRQALGEMEAWSR